MLNAEVVSPVHVRALGHVVLKVRDLERSEGFYVGLLDMRVVMRIVEPRMAFFAFEISGNHHDFALMEVGAVDAPLANDDVTGLGHVAFKIGSSPEELRLALNTLRKSETPILYEVERGFAKSVHVLDPDGNEIELYVDTTIA